MADNLRSKEILVEVEEFQYGQDKKTAWKAVFEGGKKATTFSTTFGEALKKVDLGSPPDIEVEVEPSIDRNTGKQREYRGVKEWNISRLWIGGKEIEHTTPQKGGGRGGGGRTTHPEWSYAKPEERLQTRLSIEGQKALDKAGAIVQGAVSLAVALIEKGELDKDNVVEWVVNTSKRLATPGVTDAARAFSSALRSIVVDGAGPGSQSDGLDKPSAKTRTPKSPSPGRGGTRTGTASSSPEEAAKLAKEEIRPEPPDVAELIEEAAKVYGSKKNVGLAYRDQFSREPIPSKMMAEEVEHLIGMAKSMSQTDLHAWIDRLNAVQESLV